VSVILTLTLRIFSLHKCVYSKLQATKDFFVAKGRVYCDV